jgi:type 1 glutamine amidotransferase
MKKIKISSRLKPFSGLFVIILLLIQFISCEPIGKNRALIITGQNNHNWEKSSVLLKDILDISGIFKTDILISPAKEEDMASFQPSFSKYDVIVLDYNGDPWPDQTKNNFVEYVKGGGGVVVYHAANNPFPDWKEFNEIIGLGGWGNRDESSGPYIYWENGEIIRDNSPGRGGDHGEQHAFLVVNRDKEHPITKGLPESWMHAMDELYGLLRGPATNLHVLATAYSDTATGGNGRHEPVLFTISYGEGRIFHTVLGHAGGEDETPAMECAGFITTLQRGAEWAATGSVTLDIPDNLPNSASVVKWPDFRPLTLDELMVKASSYKIGKSRKYLADLTERIRKASNSPKMLVKYEEKMIELLNSEATSDSKNYILKELSWMGSDKCIPVLKEMKENKNTEEMASYALERLSAD